MSPHYTLEAVLKFPWIQEQQPLSCKRKAKPQQSVAFDVKTWLWNFCLSTVILTKTLLFDQHNKYIANSLFPSQTLILPLPTTLFLICWYSYSCIFTSRLNHCNSLLWFTIKNIKKSCKSKILLLIFSHIPSSMYSLIPHNLNPSWSPMASGRLA